LEVPARQRISGESVASCPVGFEIFGARFLMMEFHISRDARERYQFAESLFSYAGNVVFADIGACRNSG
jgi:hypothetical protein